MMSKTTYDDDKQWLPQPFTKKQNNGDERIISCSGNTKKLVIPELLASRDILLNVAQIRNQ